MATLEAMASSAVKAAIDMGAVLMCIVCNTVAPIRAVTKYRPNQVVVVCTTQLHVAKQCNLYYGTMPLLLPSTRMNLGQIRDKVGSTDKANRSVRLGRAQAATTYGAGSHRMSAPHDALRSSAALWSPSGMHPTLGAATPNSSGGGVCQGCRLKPCLPYVTATCVLCC